jgi:dynein heavy chain
LFQRIKKTIVRFQVLPGTHLFALLIPVELLNSEQGKIVTKKYITVAKNMRDYEETLFRKFCENVEANAAICLKTCILNKEAQHDGSETIVSNFRPVRLCVLRCLML